MSSAARLPQESTAAPNRIVEGEGWLEHVEGWRVLRVKGSFYEMGRQHGVLLKKDIAKGPIIYFREHVERMLGRSLLGGATPIVWKLVQKVLGKRVARGLPDFAVETIRGMADGSGIPYQELLDGCTMPDAFMWIAARSMQYSGRGPAVTHRLALELGCTSALAWGEGTADGKMLHARNLDYYGVGPWPENKTIIFHEPDEGQRYVSVGSAGVCLGGVTSMNESGLTLTVHQHMFTDQTALGGTAIGTVGDLVMREATSLDEAQRILESHRPIGCWTYLIGDAKAKEVLCYEENPNRYAAIRKTAKDGTFPYANIYLDPELGATEVNLYGTYWRHNHGRHERAEELLETDRGKHTPQSLADIIGDAGHPDCRVRDSIAMVMTVSSVVFSPDDGIVWVGTGEAPTSRREYLPFSLTEQRYLPEAGTLEVGADESEESAGAFESFRQAYIAYLDDGDAEGAARCMDRARELAPQQSVYHSLAGLFWLNSEDAHRALECFDRAVELGHPDVERVASFHLWRGRAKDLIGRRDEALNDYRRCLARYADKPVHDAARKGLRRGFSARAARAIHVDVALGDVISP